MARPKLSLIAAMSQNHVIGRDNELPWHLPADLKHFKAITMGKPILMGRKTYESIGRPLPGRLNLILSRQTDLDIDGCTVVATVNRAIELAMKIGANELIIIGGAQLYAQTIDQADCLYLTMVQTTLEGDAFFPEFNPSEWSLVESQSCRADENNAYDYNFLRYQRD